MGASVCARASTHVVDSADVPSLRPTPASVCCVVGPPGSVKTGLCEKLRAHGFTQITLGEAQRLAVRKHQNDALGTALEAKLETDKAARKEGKEVSEGWAGSDDLNARVLEWFFRGGAEAGEAAKAHILKRALCGDFL